jgi:hypothetical protein
MNRRIPGFEEVGVSPGDLLRRLVAWKIGLIEALCDAVCPGIPGKRKSLASGLSPAVEPDVAVEIAGLDDLAVHGAGNLVRQPVRSPTRRRLAGRGIVRRRLPQSRPHRDAHRNNPRYGRDQRGDHHGPRLAHQSKRHDHNDNSHASTDQSHPPSGHLFMMPLRRHLAAG